MKKLKYLLWSLIVISSLIAINNLMNLFKVKNKYSLIAGITTFMILAGIVIYRVIKFTKRK